MPRRILNWDVEATHWAVAQLGQPFTWGATDCGSLTRAMLAVMYGEDLLPPGLTYTGLREAVDLDRSEGGVRGVLAALGAHALPGLLYANTGDVLIASPRDDEPFEAVMPVITDRFLLTAPDGVVLAVPLLQAPLDAVPFRVPHEW